MSDRAEDGSSIATAAAILLSLVLTAVRSEPPAPLPPNDEGRFSAVSALEILRDLYFDEPRHPIGTESNRRLKRRILDHLSRLGYEPTVQKTMACWESGGCGHVENILARLEGSNATGKAVLLAVHYDGVGAGPSVSDDGVAVAATLEIARILKSGPQPENDVIFLIDDGEEAFLLGASAFAARHPWAEEVGAVVNLEARGSAGRSFMFETGVDNAWLIDLMHRHLPRPASSSLFYSIYQRLPNDTDFTVFRFHGMNGVNFAFIGNVAHYHTPLDDLAHVSPASLQHHGDNALAMIRALAGADLVAPPRGTASWFDVWGFGILSWPESWNLPASLVALWMLLVTIVIHARRGELDAPRMRSGMVLYPLAASSATAVALLSSWLLMTVGKLPGWPAAAWAPRLAFWSIGIATGAFWIWAVGRRAGNLASWIGTLLWLATLALLASLLLPGGAYLFLVPALVGSGLGLLTAVRRSVSVGRIARFVTVLAAGVTQLIVAWSLWDAMGITVMPVVAILVTGLTLLVLAPSAEPLAAGCRRASLMGFALVGGLLVAALALPAFTAESPRTLNLYFVQDADTGRARLAVRPGQRPLPDALAAAADWHAEREALVPWNAGTPAYRVAAVDPIPAPPPALEVLERRTSDAGTRIRARLFSPRGAARGAVIFQQPERIASLRVEGWDFDLETDEIRAWYPDGRRVVRFATMPPEGIEIELTLIDSAPFEIYLADYSYALPPQGAGLIAARPSDTVPIGLGDLTIVHTRAEI